MAATISATEYSSGSAGTLALLVRDLELDPVENRKQIRLLLEENPRAFLPAAIDVLRSQAGTRGAQFIASLLVESGLLLSALCDPSLSHEQALELARLAMRADSNKEVILGRASADRVASSRVIRILEQNAGGKDFLPLLIRLLRQPNPYLRSKAVLLLARDTRNVNWVRKTLADADPRIRANAVEAIWGVDTADARELLGSLRGDANNRVAGNALLGLYRLGDATAIPEIVAMSQYSEPLFRTTSAWVMGETGHPRFIEALSELINDSSAATRRAARTALGRIHTAVGRARDLPARLVSARYLMAGAEQRSVALAVGTAAAEIPPLLQTQVYLAEDGRPVHRYRLERPPSSERLAVRFLVPTAESGTPTSWGSHVLACLHLKRNTDSWSCVPYASGVPQSADAQSEFTLAPLQADETAIRQDFTKMPLLPARTDVWHAVWRSIQADAGEPGIRPHLIICNDSPSDCAAGPVLISEAKESSGLIQVVSSVPNAALESLCKQVGGIFLLGRPRAGMVALVEQAYLNLQVHYRVIYEPVARQPRALTIVVADSEGWGETSIPVPLTSG